MYICIRLNTLRYELHKLHFLNFFFHKQGFVHGFEIPASRALIVGMAAHD